MSLLTFLEEYTSLFLHWLCSHPTPDFSFSFVCLVCPVSDWESDAWFKRHLCRKAREETERLIHQPCFKITKVIHIITSCQLPFCGSYSSVWVRQVFISPLYRCRYWLHEIIELPKFSRPVKGRMQTESQIFRVLVPHSQSCLKYGSSFWRKQLYLLCSLLLGLREWRSERSGKKSSQS